MKSGIAINREASRCINAILNVSLIMKSLYWSNFLRQVYYKKVYYQYWWVRIQQFCQASNSWLHRVSSLTIINDVFWGRVNLILGVSQEGDYLGLVLNKGITLKVYWLYLMILLKILKSLRMDIRKVIIIVQD